MPAAGGQSGIAPAKQPNCDPMKRKEVLKSLADLSTEVVEAEAARPAQASPKPSPAGAEQPREPQSPIREPENSGFPGYEHWGLNE